MIVVEERHFPHTRILHVVGPLQAPVNAALRRRVAGLLQRGRRSILVDLARVPDIDAAGVGELAQLYRLAAAANVVLQVSRACRRVRLLLDLAGVLGVLGADSVAVHEEGSCPAGPAARWALRAGGAQATDDCWATPAAACLPR